MDIFVKLFDVLFPVFLTISIGYWYGKKDPTFDTEIITKFAGNIGLPSIIFYSLTISNIDIQTFLKFSKFIIFYVIIFSFVGIFVIKVFKKDIFRLLPPIILPNTGNMGMPICLFAYGTTGLSIATAITSIILVLHFSLGILLASREFSLKPLLKCTPIYALIFSLFFVYFSIPAPKFLENTTFLLGYSTIFLVLMSLGVALSKLKVFFFAETLTYSLIRVLIGPLVGFAFIIFFNLTGVEAGVMFIQASMPSAILTYLVGSIYSSKEISDNIASTVALSTFLSFFTLPIIVYIAIRYFN
jgi:predicted permease|tara:strand:+ start:2751 stop:3650 length:900 start_codon:yes stop_codon:yes gene_type:complete